MSLKVTGVFLLDDVGNVIGNPGGLILGWHGIVSKLNIQVTVDGAHTSAAALPDKILVNVQTQEPVRRLSGNASMRKPFPATLTRQGKNPRSGGRKDVAYDATVTLTDLALFFKPGDQLNEVATVVRQGGTSDQKFLEPLMSSWALRGVAVQPPGGPPPPPATDNLAVDRPDAMGLLLAGGVEVLEVSMPRQADLDISRAPRRKIFIRSPADVFFYSGHGGWWNGALLIQQPGHAENHTYKPWVGPDEILAAWKKLPDINLSPMDLDVLIINGCSVLFWNHKHEALDAYERKDFGLQWAKLLVSGQGPLFAILGYRFSAPLDSDGGNDVAREMGEAIATRLGKNWWDYGEEWLKINAKRPNTRTAAVLDTKGYRYINLAKVPKWPEHLTAPGYDPKLPEGTVMKPIPLP